MPDGTSCWATTSTCLAGSTCVTKIGEFGGGDFGVCRKPSSTPTATATNATTTTVIATSTSTVKTSTAPTTTMVTTTSAAPTTTTSTAAPTTTTVATPSFLPSLADQAEVVKAHNDARSETALKGLCANMLMMKWDDKVASVASTYTNACGNVINWPGDPHNPNKDAEYKALGGVGPVGENWAAGTDCKTRCL